MSSDEKPADGKPADQKPADGPEADGVKAAFREALARKNSQRHAHNQGGEDTGKVHAHERASTKRMFRRKSG